LLIVFTLMACFGAMLPSGAQASTPTVMRMDVPAMAHAGCMHHHDKHVACHDCPICTGVDLPRLAVWANRVDMPATLVRTPAQTALLAGVRPAGLDRPPRRQG
jgi:hypothetical protein